MQFTLLGLGEDMPGAKCATQLSFVSKGARTRGKQARKGGALWGPWAGSSSRPRRTAGLEHRVGTAGGNEVRTVVGPAHREVLARSPHLHQQGPFPGGKLRLYFQQQTDRGQGIPDQLQETGQPGLWGCSRCPNLWPQATETSG